MKGGRTAIALIWVIGLSTAGAQEIVRGHERARFRGGTFRRGLHSLQLEQLLRYCRVTSPRPEENCRPEYFALEQPLRRIRLGPFALDRYEVSNRRYAACLSAGRCTPSRTTPGDARIGEDTMPVVNITWEEARTFCEWAGGRLPSESEWERAARGLSGRRFPWGQNYNDRYANHGRLNQPDPSDGYAFAAPVGSFPSGATRDGVHDLAGNVWEWTADGFSDNSDWQAGFSVNPQGDASIGLRIRRGGSWLSGAIQLRGGYREPIPAERYAPDLGFRCAYDS